jgi:tetratricopeptide (TPR) repeat protein
MGKVELAIRLAQQGVAIYRRTGATMRLANAKYALGRALTQSGGWRTGAALFNDALKIFQDSRNEFWSAMTRCRLAELHLAAGCPDMAAHQAEQALTLRHTYGELWHAKILTVLGQALTGISHDSRAGACWQEALGIYERLGSEEAEQTRAFLAHHDAKVFRTTGRA